LISCYYIIKFTNSSTIFAEKQIIYPCICEEFWIRAWTKLKYIKIYLIMLIWFEKMCHVSASRLSIYKWSRHFGLKKKFFYKNSAILRKSQEKKAFWKKCIFVESRPKTVFGDHLEFRRHFIFWSLVIFFFIFFHIKIYKIHVKHILKVFWPTGRFFSYTFSLSTYSLLPKIGYKKMCCVSARRLSIHKTYNKF
jgi:hypothetical protein